MRRHMSVSCSPVVTAGAPVAFGVVIGKLTHMYGADGDPNPTPLRRSAMWWMRSWTRSRRQAPGPAWQLIRTKRVVANSRTLAGVQCDQAEAAPSTIASPHRTDESFADGENIGML